MKKIITTALCVLMFCLLIVGCSQGKNEAPVDPTQHPTNTNNDTFAPLKIKEYGYEVKNGYLHYAVILNNPNENFAVEFPTFRITARDADNLILGTETQVLSVIYPQQDFAYASLAFEIDQQPAKVDIEIVEPEEYNIIKPTKLENPEYVPLEVVNTTKRNDKVLGEIQNTNSYAIDQAVVCTIVRDNEGKIIGGDSTFIDSIPASGSAPFEIRCYFEGEYETFEVYANLW